MLVLSPSSEHRIDLPHPTGVILVDAVPSSALRQRAIADANVLRALAWVALRDGMPGGSRRAATARSSARAVIAHTRRLCAILEKRDRPWTRSLLRYAAE